MLNQDHGNVAPKILIVSDNAELSSHVIALLTNEPHLRHLTYELRYSFRNHSPDPMKALGATSIDLRNDTEVDNIINTADIVFSLHCKQIFPAKLVNNITCINVHPGYNPYNRGWYPQVFSIINKLPAGVTIHLMDDDIDHGPIIYQQQIVIQDYDTSFDIYRKIISTEKDMLNVYFGNLVFGNYKTFQPEHSGNYNSITDFNNLCELDLDSTASLKEHLNLLRALSHDNFKNAYFVGSDGKKYFVKLTITPEHQK